MSGMIRYAFQTGNWDYCQRTATISHVGFLKNIKLTILPLSGYLTNGFGLITPTPKLPMNRQHYKAISRKQRLPLKSPTSAPSGRQLNKHFSKQLLSQMSSLSLHGSPLIHVVASVSLKWECRWILVRSESWDRSKQSPWNVRGRFGNRWETRQLGHIDFQSCSDRLSHHRRCVCH
jgi:hypothetical protein